MRPLGKGDKKLMKMTNEEYKDFSDKRQPRSKVLANICKAFLVGGLICCIGQLITDLFRNAGLSLEDAGSALGIARINRCRAYGSRHLR